MKIPTVKMTVPVFSEREYAPTPTSVNPAQEIDVKIREHEVSLEYAAFLIKEKIYVRGWYEFPRTEYINELFEAMMETHRMQKLKYDLTGQIFYGFSLFSDDEFDSMIKRRLNIELDNAIENDNTSTLDWI